MPDTGLIIFLITIVLGLAFSYANGINDAANAIATVVSTRVLPPMAAVAMGVSLNIVGALMGSEVARRIGSEIVELEMINEYTVMAAMLASVIWVLMATRVGFPISVSHSLVASLVGSSLATAGTSSIIFSGLISVVIALAISPFAGFVVAFAAMVGLYWLMRRSAPGTVRVLFTPLQIMAGGFMAYSHGKNDAQNAIGVIALATAVYYSQAFNIELWMKLISAGTIGLGTALGGWRVIRTLGLRITKLEPIHGFAASMAAGSVIEVASNIGLPVSTTHTISGSIMGVGATKRLSAVRWGVTRSMALAWLVTYPVCFVLGLSLSFLFRVVIP